MECVIKIVAGPELGQEFRCGTGETVLGRSPRSAIRLTAPSVSYEHALISRGSEGFFVENLSANGTYLNNERLTGKSRLRARDQIRLGEETIARVEAVPTGTGTANSRVLLLGALVGLLLLGLIAVVIDPFSGGSPQRNWAKAHTQLQEWAAAETGAGRLPRDTLPLFSEAWRLQTANDRINAPKAWVRLRIYLASSDIGAHYQELAQRDPRVLTRLLEAPPTATATQPALPSDDMGAALVQFVSQMERSR